MNVIVMMMNGTQKKTRIDSYEGKVAARTGNFDEFDWACEQIIRQVEKNIGLSRSEMQYIQHNTKKDFFNIAVKNV